MEPHTISFRELLEKLADSSLNVDVNAEIVYTYLQNRKKDHPNLFQLPLHISKYESIPEKLLSLT